MEENSTRAFKVMSKNRKQGIIDKSNDVELQLILDETVSKFNQIDYSDIKTGRKFSYNIFIPKNYNVTKAYPLVLFLIDASAVGEETKVALTQGYGAVVWALKEEQQKHPCFIVAPEYPENILNGEDKVTSHVDATLNLLEIIQKDYNIDTNRLYITGQSMGCMTALYLNGTHPDLFAASIYVDGQWNTDILQPLENQKFFYFSAQGDKKASKGMENVKAMFDKDNVNYVQEILDAKAPNNEINELIDDVISKGYHANFISWKKGSVLPDDVDGNSRGVEHMYSFDHAYKIRNVRDWLFKQSK